VLAVTKPTKDCLHSSQFGQVDGENIETLSSLGSGGHVCCPPHSAFAAQQHWLLPTRCTVHCSSKAYSLPTFHENPSTILSVILLRDKKKDRKEKYGRKHHLEKVKSALLISTIIVVPIFVEICLCLTHFYIHCDVHGLFKNLHTAIF